jgi:superfamily I DNA and/or RNA helicase
MADLHYALIRRIAKAVQYRLSNCLYRWSLHGDGATDHSRFDEGCEYLFDPLDGQDTTDLQASHVAIIGDHKQLPPVIISPEAHAGGLATSLFERLIHEKSERLSLFNFMSRRTRLILDIPSIMLDTQYRMHPDISAFPNRAFYAGALHDGTTHEGVNFDPPISAYLVPDSNITFLDHYHPETPQSASLANHGDANIVSNIIADLLYHNKGLKGSQIGVITAYSAQVKTVDGFQGREKEIMIVSMVRCNPGGWVGFLGDWRRLNVALTRARRVSPLS